SAIAEQGGINRRLTVRLKFSDERAAAIGIRRLKCARGSGEEERVRFARDKRRAAGIQREAHARVIARAAQIRGIDQITASGVELSEEGIIGAARAALKRAAYRKIC